MSPISSTLAGASARGYGGLGASVTAPVSYANAFESIATATVTGSSQAEIEFLTIPQTFKHLQLRGLFRSDYASTGAGAYLIINNNTAGTYRSFVLYGNASAIVDSYDSGALSFGMYWGLDTAANSPASVFGAQVVDILDYTSTTKNKVVRLFSGKEQNIIDSAIHYSSGIYVDAATPITRLKIRFGGAAQWAQHTTVALYGMKG